MNLSFSPKKHVPEYSRLLISAALLVAVFSARTSQDILVSEELTMSEYQNVMAELARLQTSVAEINRKLGRVGSLDGSLDTRTTYSTPGQPKGR